MGRQVVGWPALAGVRKQRRLTGVVDLPGAGALQLRGETIDRAGADLAAVGDEGPQQAQVLVVDVGDIRVEAAARGACGPSSWGARASLLLFLMGL